MKRINQAFDHIDIKSWQRQIVANLVCAFLLLPTALVLPSAFSDEAPVADPIERPNILLILVDDLGFSDIGCYGGEINTPNLDGLANDGIRFTQFYNTARCWPTRAALLTGYYAQQVRRDTVPGIESGARGMRPVWAPLVPKFLKPLGYRSYHSGKWHIDGMPIESGFDRSYYLRDQGRFFNPQAHWEDDQKLPIVQPGSDFYGTTAIANHAVKCLREHHAEHSSKPFFHYLAFTAPHFPLHALPDDIAKYANNYAPGWTLLREQRFRRINESGLLSTTLSDPERDLGPPYHFPDALKILGRGEVNRSVAWDSLNEMQRAFQSNKMAIHAAMVDRVDVELGKVLDQLRRMKTIDNTLIFFLSDNGASAEIMVRDDGHDPTAAPGSAATYLCLGPGWSTMCNTPLRRHKTWVHEGGISTPLIVHWPAGVEAKNEFRRTPGHVIDIVPTIMDVVGSATPDVIDGQRVPKPPGHSLRPLFEQDGSVRHDELWWLHEGNRAIRVGDWKLVAAMGDAWELYDLAHDRTETTDLASRFPDRVAELAAAWEQRLESIHSVAKSD